MLRSFGFPWSPSVTLTFNEVDSSNWSNRFCTYHTASLPLLKLFFTTGIPTFSFTIYSLRNSRHIYLLLDLCQYLCLSQFYCSFKSEKSNSKPYDYSMKSCFIFLIKKNLIIYPLSHLFNEIVYWTPIVC